MLNIFRSERAATSRRRGLTLLEVVFALAIVSMVVLAIYGAITSGVTSLRMARENLRATQILVEKTEVIRLYNWDQINSSFIPKEFVVPYDVYASGTNGAVYRGTITVDRAATGTSYSNDLRLVTVRLDWETGHLKRTRTLNTYVCRTGIQNYVY